MSVPVEALDILRPMLNGTLYAATSTEINITDPPFSANGNDGIDDTAAFNMAIQAAGSMRKIYLPKGKYIVSSELLINNDRVRIAGEGVNITVIDFRPITDGALFKVSNGAAINFQSMISGMTLTSQDTTHTKIALDIWDVSEFDLYDISIAGANGHWQGAGSVGLQTHGREATRVKKLTIFAEKPVQISDNPNHLIDIDHWHFEDLYLASNIIGSPLITIDSGVNLTDTTFDGIQPLVGGAGIFYWNDTTSTISSYGLSISNVRGEQTTNANSWMIYIKHNVALYGLHLTNLHSDPGNHGLYLRKIFSGTIRGFEFTGPGVALDYDQSNWGLDVSGSYFLAGSTVNLTGQRVVNAVPKFPVSAPLPSSFSLHNAALSTQTVFSDAAVSQPIVTVADNAMAVLGQGTLMGLLAITSSAGETALYSLSGAAHTTIEIADTAAKYSAVANTPLSTNIYWDTSAARYLLQNRSGGMLKYSLMLFGAYEGF